MIKNIKCLLFTTALLCTWPLLAAAKETAPPADPAPLMTAASEAADALIEELYDNYCCYYTADEYQLMYDDYNGVFGGVGISMMQDDEGYIVIYKVLANGPAKETRIQAGDRIIAVDGESIVGCDTDQAALKIRGDVNSKVTLTLSTPGGEEYSVTITRQEITDESVSFERIEEAKNTGYILIYSFTGQTAQEFADAFNQLREDGKIDNLIIDLRSNVGGNFFAAIGIADFFIPAGHTVVSEKLAADSQIYTANSGKLSGINLLLLTNEWTASASEVLAGALRDEAGATLIGTTTFGKGITQSLMPLNDGGMWKYTQSRYFTPSGFDLHGVGLVPDVEVLPPETITNEEYFSTDPALDPHLEAAVKYIQSQK